MQLLIKNPTIVTSSSTFQADILIADGKIIAIDKDLNPCPEHSEVMSFKASRSSDRCVILKTIDATSMLAFPGGIDPHVHMHLPTPAGYSSDDFRSGSLAALYGGTTTFIDFVTPNRGQSLVDALDVRMEEAKGSLIDYSFHISPVEWRESTEEEIIECIRRGFTSFKVYMAYKNSVGIDEEVLQKVLKAVGKHGGIVTVHAELGDEIEQLRNSFYNEGKVEPLYHCFSRPPYTESEAVCRVIQLAEKASCPLYIVHVSTKESLDHIRKARERGQVVYAETCPQYLLLDDSYYQKPFFESAPFVISPPLRKIEDQEALWNGLGEGTIQTIGTDHCPFSLAQKEKGINDFRQIPNGAGGVEHRLSLLYTYGVLANRITMTQLMNLISSQPAKIFGMSSLKGEFVVGADADIVLWNPLTEGIISRKTHHSLSDISIYEGVRTVGFAELVISKGIIALENGKNVSINEGQIIRRNSSAKEKG